MGNLTIPKNRFGALADAAMPEKHQLLLPGISNSNFMLRGGPAD